MYSIQKHKEISEKLYDDNLSIDEFKKAFKEAVESKDSLKAEYSSMTKDQLLGLMSTMGKYRYKNEKKDVIVNAIADDVLMTFMFGTFSWSHGQDKIKLMSEKVEKTTQQDLDNYAKEVAERREEYKKKKEEFLKAMENPETLDEFKMFIERKGKDKLTPDQLKRYDELVSFKTKDKQQSQIESKATISKVEGIEGIELNIIETKHTKTGEPLYVVKLSERVERSIYDDLNKKAKQLSGWYSSYTKGGAIAGFQFKEKSQAEKFIGLKEGSVSNLEKVEERAEIKEEKRVNKLRENANAIIERVDKELNRERLTNTARRARMASSAESNLEAEKAIAKTMLNIADAIDSGEIKFLDKISSKAQIEQLNTIVAGANYRYLKEKYPEYRDYEAHKYDNPTEDVVSYISKYDMFLPQIYKEHLLSALNEYSNYSGLKLVTQRIKKRLPKGENKEYQVSSKSEMEDFIEFAYKIPVGHKSQWVKDIALKHKRLLSMGIESDEMLRAAIREFIQFKEGKKSVDKVKELSRNLVGKKVGIDFFPTPIELAEKMVEMADIKEGMTVLEPSAGSGNIADAIKNISGITPDVIEISGELGELLKAKGYDVIANDFISFNEKKYDKIIMNPPFSNSMDAEHVRHAYELLNDGGRIVAIMGEGIFFRSDKKATDFREWSESVNAEVDKLPEGTFKDRTLLATTGANARLVVIDKESMSVNEKLYEIREKYGEISADLAKKQIDILGEKSVDFDRLIKISDRIIELGETKPANAIAEALQYELVYLDDFNDVRQVIEKGGIELNRANIERMIEVGVNVPNDILNKINQLKIDDSDQKTFTYLGKSKMFAENIIKEIEAGEKTKEEVINDLFSKINKATHNIGVRKSSGVESDGFIKQNYEYIDFANEAIKIINEHFKPESEGISLKEFEDLAKNIISNSKTKNIQEIAKEFRDKSQQIKNVPKAVADLFFEKYGDGGNLSPQQASENFIKSLIGIDKTEILPQSQESKKIAEKLNLTIFLVDGEFIRNNYSVDYILGSHHLVDNFIPENEIWIEQTLSESDREAIIYHELVECEKMRIEGWNYETAHEFATDREKEFREKNKDASPEQKAKEFINNLSSDQLKEITEKFKEIVSQVVKEQQDKLDELEAQKQKLVDEKNETYEKEKESEGTVKYDLMKRRSEIYEIIKRIDYDILNQKNRLLAVAKQGNLNSFTDLKGKEFKDVPDFTKITTEQIIFDEETILTDAIPSYIPFINEEKYRLKGYTLDAIRITTDTYLTSISEHQEEKGYYVLLTLDQLVLVNDYYLTKAKAILIKESKEKNERNQKYWDSLPEERREKFLNQKGLYRSLPAKIQKTITQEKYESLSWQEKEKIYKFYKRTGIKRLNSKLDEHHMWASLHRMYERFVNPEAKEPKPRTANPEVWAYWTKFRDMMEWKIKDIRIQREDLSDVRKAALETSFGESNTDDVLKEEFGILVKRQNGSKINPVEINEIRTAWEQIQQFYGDLKANANDVNMKISHSGNKFIFASKAIGMYLSSMNTIAISNKYGELEFKNGLAHEVAHWIDHLLGKKQGKRYSTDNYESISGLLAFEFRRNLNLKTDSIYVNATKECFARALEQYFALKNQGESASIIYSFKELDNRTPYYKSDNYVNEANFNEKIKPLIDQFFEENKDFFKYTIVEQKTDELDLKQNVERNAALANLDEIKEKGSIRVADPVAIVEKINKYSDEKVIADTESGVVKLALGEYLRAYDDKMYSDISTYEIPQELLNKLGMTKTYELIFDKNGDRVKIGEKEYKSDKYRIVIRESKSERNIPEFDISIGKITNKEPDSTFNIEGRAIDNLLDYPYMTAEGMEDFNQKILQAFDLIEEDINKESKKWGDYDNYLPKNKPFKIIFEEGYTGTGKWNEATVIYDSKNFIFNIETKDGYKISMGEKQLNEMINNGEYKIKSDIDDWMEGKNQFGASRKDLLDMWTKQAKQEIEKGKSKEQVISELREMAKAYAGFEEEKEKLLPIIADNLEKEELVGGKADGYNIYDIAARWNVDIEFAQEQLANGIIIESEHSNDPEKQEEISLDHLYENIAYYQELKKMEAKLESKKNVEIKVSSSGSIKVGEIYPHSGGTAKVLDIFKEINEYGQSEEIIKYEYKNDTITKVETQTENAFLSSIANQLDNDYIYDTNKLIDLTDYLMGKQEHRIFNGKKVFDLTDNSVWEISQLDENGVNLISKPKGILDRGKTPSRMGLDWSTFIQMVNDKELRPEGYQEGEEYQFQLIAANVSAKIRSDKELQEKQRILEEERKRLEEEKQLLAVEKENKEKEVEKLNKYKSVAEKQRMDRRQKVNEKINQRKQAEIEEKQQKSYFEQEHDILIYDKKLIFNKAAVANLPFGSLLKRVDNFHYIVMYNSGKAKDCELTYADKKWNINQCDVPSIPNFEFKELNLAITYVVEYLNKKYSGKPSENPAELKRYIGILTEMKEKAKSKKEIKELQDEISEIEEKLIDYQF